MSSSGCPYCGTAINKIVENCSYCKKELPESEQDFKKEFRLIPETKTDGYAKFKKEIQGLSYSKPK